jgi:hypothetical protein
MFDVYPELLKHDVGDLCFNTHSELCKPSQSTIFDQWENWVSAVAVFRRDDEPNKMANVLFDLHHSF